MKNLTILGDSGQVGGRPFRTRGETGLKGGAMRPSSSPLNPPAVRLGGSGRGTRDGAPGLAPPPPAPFLPAPRAPCRVAGVPPTAPDPTGVPSSRPAPPAPVPRASLGDAHPAMSRPLGAGAGALEAASPRRWLRAAGGGGGTSGGHRRRRHRRRHSGRVTRPARPVRAEVPACAERRRASGPRKQPPRQRAASGGYAPVARRPRHPRFQPPAGPGRERAAAGANGSAGTAGGRGRRGAGANGSAETAGGGAGAVAPPPPRPPRVFCRYSAPAPWTSPVGSRFFPRTRRSAWNR